MRSLRIGLMVLLLLTPVLLLWTAAGQSEPPVRAAGPLAATPLYLPSVMRAGAAPTSSIPITGQVVFAIGPSGSPNPRPGGGVDNIPHQIVRAANDRLYVFSAAQDSPLISVYVSKGNAPASSADFNAPVSVTESEIPLSVDAAYDGGSVIFALVNTDAGKLKVYPFDVAQNAFKPAITLATGNPTPPAGLYIGTQGVSGMVDKNGVLQIAFWAAGNQIRHRAYTYSAAANSLTLVGAETRLDTAGSANHPALVVSPLDNSITVAWVWEKPSGNTIVGTILARTRSAAGTWGSVETVSTADAWTSTDNGINIDQGPVLVVGADGTRHLVYMQDFDNTGQYGRLHYVAKTGASWSDTALSFYSHAPALGITSAGTLYLFGHGHPKNPAGPCLNMDDMCYMTKPSGGSWGALQMLQAHFGTQTFDSSPSVKWSATGWNRPELLEVIFFGIANFNYTLPTLYYARLP